MLGGVREERGEIERGPEGQESGTRTGGGGEVPPVSGLILEPPVANWVIGAGAEDNERYKNFLIYMEEKREEARQHLLEDRERKREAKKKEDSWALMRESVIFLKKNADKWRKTDWRM